jgi:hypothetical protein
MWRFAIGCFAFTAIAFAFQLFPLPGIFLMMLAAPLWSVVTVNLGFAALAAEAWRTPELRWLAIFPIAWFGGYLMVAAYSHWLGYQHNLAISAFNEKIDVSFNPAAQDIVVEPNDRDSTNGSPLTASNLVHSFNLRRAYEVVRSPKGTVQQYVLREVDCPGTAGVGMSGDVLWNKLNDGGYGSGRDMTFAQDLCFFISYTSPDLPAVRIRPREQAVEHGLATFVSQDIEVREPSGRNSTLRSGWAVPLSWFPQPMIGCWLNSGAAKWMCDAGFGRQSIYSPSEDRSPNGPDDVIGKALGLEKLSIRERYPKLKWTARR